MGKRISSLALLLAMTAAACGSGAPDVGLATLDGPAGSQTDIASVGGSDPAIADDAAAMDTEEAMLAFAQCLRDQGLEVADPEIGDDGRIRLGRILRPSDESTIGHEAMRTAMDACSEYRDLITTGFEEFDRTAIEDQIYAYAACMRDNGYEMADPDFSDFGNGSGQERGEPGERVGPFGDMDPTDPEFQAANEVCSDLFAGFGPGGGGLLPGGGPPGGGAPGGDPPDGSPPGGDA